jgi:hypothetical protein
MTFHEILIFLFKINFLMFLFLFFKCDDVKNNFLKIKKIILIYIFLKNILKSKHSETSLNEDKHEEFLNISHF